MVMNRPHHETVKAIRKLDVIDRNHYRAEFVDRATGDRFVSDVRFVEREGIKGLEFSLMSF